MLTFIFLHIETLKPIDRSVKLMRLVRGSGYDCNRWFVMSSYVKGLYDVVLFHSLSKIECIDYMLKLNR